MQREIEGMSALAVFAALAACVILGRMALAPDIPAPWPAFPSPRGGLRQRPLPPRPKGHLPRLPDHYVGFMHPLPPRRMDRTPRVIGMARKRRR